MGLESEGVSDVNEEILSTETPVVETVTTEVDAAEKPATMDDTLRAKFRELTKDPAAAAEVGKPAPVDPAKAAAPVAPEVKVDEQGRVRGPDGKFATKETPDPAVAVDPAKAAAPAAPVAPVEPSIAKAPTSWKGEAQAKWEALPPEIKAEVHRREGDFHKGIQSYKQKSDTFDILDAEIRPYEAMIRAAGTNPQTAIRDFFNTAYLLKTGSPEAKVETFLNIANEYGVDLGLLPQVQEKMLQGQPVVSPEYRQLEQRFNALNETITQRDAREKQERDDAARAEMQAIAQETAQWSAGKEHYEAVKLDMAALLESGRAQTLDEAYDKAIWANPEVRTKQIAQQQEAQRKQAADTAAAAKKAASTNVAPRGTPPSKPTAKVGTMEDTIRDALKKIRSTG